MRPCGKTGTHLESNSLFRGMGMNIKIMKKNTKRLTTDKRAKQQAAKRKDRIEGRKLKEQIAQDIYPAGTNQRKEEHKLKDFKYDMFEFGDPQPVNVKSSLNPPTRQKTKDNAGRNKDIKSHLSEKQKANKKTLMSRKKTNKAKEKKVREDKKKIKNKLANRRK